MNRLLNELKNIFAVIIIIIILLSYFGVFIPLKNELEDSMHENFKRLVSIAEINLENHFSRAIEGAEGLSSRTMINNEIEKYKNREVTFQQLQQYTQPKYEDGAVVLEHLLAAYRIVDNNLVAHFGEEYLELINDLNFNSAQNNQVIITDDQKYIIVKSAVETKEGDRLGSDYIIYNLRDIFADLNPLNLEDINYNISSGLDIAESGVQNGKTVEIRRLLNTDYYLKVEISTADIYQGISRISYRIMLIVLTSIIIISLVVTKFLHNTSKKIVDSLRKELDEKTRLSETDEMLDIYNRSKFNQELEKEIDRAERYNNYLSLIMIDIDYFKEFNDSYGHQVGDKILKKIVSIVKEMIRKHDILARYGGDEFMLICPQTGIEDAESMAERLKEAIYNYNCEHDYDLSCSFGVAEFKLNQDDKDSLINKVDKALYIAKDEGRNRVCSEKG